MNVILTAMMWCAIQVTVLACSATLVNLGARRIHPRAGAAAAGGALAMVLLLTMLVVSPWPRWNLSITGDEAVAAAATTAPTTIPGAADKAPPNKDPVATPPHVQLDSPQRAFWSALLHRLNNPRPGLEAKPRAAGWGLVIAGVFVCGILVTAARLAWGVASVRRLARRARFVDDANVNTMASELQRALQLKGTVAVYESDELATPATVGWWRPIVLLPAARRSWNDERLRAAIAHELAHIAGRDYAAWLVARLAVVAHFYHPLVRWLAARLQLEQELAADMTAARLLGDAKQYLHSLAALALATPPQHVAGPARTLIPSRSLLVRRVEMLRTLGINRPRRPAARYATFAAVALFAVAAAGLRGPTIEVTSAAFAEELPAENAAAPGEGLSLELVPPDALFVVSARPAQIVARDELSELPKMFSDLTHLLAEAKLTPSDVVEVMAMRYGKPDESSGRGPGVLPNVRLVLRFATPAKQHDIREWLLAWAEDRTKHPMKKASDAAVWLAHDGRLAEVDPVTLMVDQVAYPAKTELPPLKNPLPRWAEAWRARNDEPVVAAVDVRSWLKGNGLASLDARQWLPVGELSFQTFYPLMLYVDWAVAGVDMKEKIAVSVVVQSDDKQKAERVRDTLQALLVMTRNMAGVYDMAQVPEGTPGATQITLTKKVAEIAGNLLDSAKLTVDDGRVNVSLQTKESTQQILQLAKTMLPSVEEARQAARQQVSMNNMKQLALAMMMYESVHKAFPPAASYTYKNGKSKYPHSWRIDVLPYLEQQKLYEQYHFDEPWDSEANKKVLAKMPDVFRSPHQSDPRDSSYFVLAGPGAVFDGETGTKLKQITDGTSRTILLVEAKRPVPWTKPEDLPYAADKPLPTLGGWMPGEFLVAIADGSVRPVAANVEEKLLRAWISRSGGENVPDLPVPRGGQ